MFYLLIGVMFISADCQPQITTSPEYLCLGDLVQLNCTAQGSARWRSDDILGPDQFISFDSGDSINRPETVGIGTGVLLETDPCIVTSLSFNLTPGIVETSCTDNQFRTTTITSSLQPSPNGDYSVKESGGSITWGPPSNIDDFLLQNYQLTIECNERVVNSVNTRNTSYSYDEGKLIPGPCTVTVRVINSCGATASNSIVFTFEVPTEFPTDNNSNNIGLGIGLGIGISVSGFIVLVIMVHGLYFKDKIMERCDCKKLSQSNDVENQIIITPNEDGASYI